MDDLLTTIRTNINNTHIDLTTTISNLGNKSDKSTTYTMTQVNNLLTTKLNNTTGSVSTSIKHSSGDDVAILYNNASKDVELKGKCVVYNNLSAANDSIISGKLSVYGDTLLSNKLIIRCPGGGGNIRTLPDSDGSEASIGLYNYIDQRADVAGSMFVSGINCWDRAGNYSIGTPIKNACLTIGSDGNVLIPYNLTVSGTLNSSTNAATYTATFNNSVGQISLNGSNGKYIGWNTNGANSPSTGTRSNGTKLLLDPGVNSNDVDFAIGIAPSTLWYSVPSNVCMHKWFSGTNTIAALGSSGMVVSKIFSNSSSTYLNASVTLTIAQLLGGIIVCSSANVITLTLPTGTLIHSGMLGGNSSTISFNQGFEWSIINTGSSTGVVVIAENTSHTLVGNSALDIGKNARFLTKLTNNANTAYSYRIA
jgi:hypothetical protein